MQTYKVAIAIFILVIMTIGLLAAATALGIVTFDNLLTSEVIQFGITPNEHVINYCYQESANISTSCGGLATGSYYSPTGWLKMQYPYSCTSTSDNIFDGNWSSFSAGCSTPTPVSAIYINYTIPVGATDALWQIYGAKAGNVNLTIPTSCFVTTVSLKIEAWSRSNNATDVWSCFDYATSSFTNLTTPNIDAGDSWVYEEAMIWNIPAEYSVKRNLTLWKNSFVRSATFNISGSLLTANMSYIMANTGNWSYNNFNNSDSNGATSSALNGIVKVSSINVTEVLDANSGYTAGFHTIRVYPIINKTNIFSVHDSYQELAVVSGGGRCFEWNWTIPSDIDDVLILRDGEGHTFSEGLGAYFSRTQNTYYDCDIANWTATNIPNRNGSVNIAFSSYRASNISAINSSYLNIITYFNLTQTSGSSVGGQNSTISLVMPSDCVNDTTIDLFYFINISHNFASTREEINRSIRCINNSGIVKNIYDFTLQVTASNSNLTSYNWGIYEENVSYQQTSAPKNTSITLSNFFVFRQDGYLLTTNATNNFNQSLDSVKGSCNCLGCTDTGLYCTMPLVFSSSVIGSLNYSFLNINYSTIPYVNWVSPVNDTTISFNRDFICNASDATSLSNMTINIWNSTGLYNSTTKAATTLFNATTFNINFTATGYYNWSCQARNVENNLGYTPFNYSFYSETTNLVTTLISPENTSYSNSRNYNFSCKTEGANLNTVFFHSNFNGSLSINNSNRTAIANQNVNFSVTNLSDNSYLWSCSANSTSSDTKTFAFNGYRNHTVDTIAPLVSITSISTTGASKSFTVSTTETDLHLKNCSYSIYNSTGSLFGNNKTSFSSGCNNDFAGLVTGDFGIYNLFIYSSDYANNENVTNQTFTLTSTPTVLVIGGGGGGGNAPGNRTWIMVTETGTETYKLSVSTNSTREKDLRFLNQEDREITVSLTCVDLENIFCQYVSFDNSSLVLPIGENIMPTTTMTLSIPDSVSYERYVFNIVATDQYALTDTVSVELSISSLGVIFEITDKLVSTKDIGGVKIPYFFFALLIGIIIFVVVNYLILKNKPYGFALALISSIMLGAGSLLFF